MDALHSLLSCGCEQKHLIEIMERLRPVTDPFTQTFPSALLLTANPQELGCLQPLSPRRREQTLLSDMEMELLN